MREGEREEGKREERRDRGRDGRLSTVGQYNREGYLKRTDKIRNKNKE